MSNNDSTAMRGNNRPKFYGFAKRRRKWFSPVGRNRGYYSKWLGL